VTLNLFASGGWDRKNRGSSKSSRPSADLERRHKLAVDEFRRLPSFAGVRHRHARARIRRRTVQRAKRTPSREPGCCANAAVSRRG
jgi:hypothetical protein